MFPTRRDMLQTVSCGFGYLALQALCGQPGTALGAEDLTQKVPAHPARAKRVIFLCMSGGPAHMDTFDYKPQTGKEPHPGSAFEFAQHGESGLWISELLPETARHADELCVINGMHADTTIHAQSFLQLHTGDRLRERPSLGSWITYGLGTENQNLPGFVSFNTSKSSIYSSAFLPSIYNGTPIGVNGEDMSQATISNIASDHLSYSTRRRQLELTQFMNRNHLESRQGDQTLESVIESMELGFRMQMSAPELLDLSSESKETLERYRVGENNEQIGTCKPSDFGRQCLLARRFAEAGVRFIEVNHGSWDQHKNHRRDLTANCQATDAPIAALLDDLKLRGMLDDTLVVWGGEFGRPGIKPEDKSDATGHNSRGFTFWLAGAGVKGGYVHGKTDDTGSRAVEGKVHFRDLHATILHALGLPPNELKYWHAGRDHRLTGPEGGQVVSDLFA
ncbi:DUF1501 domain-containing protein [Rubinisphaera margarita]|uniref:DUF1501 domain-containing protein n=1 Tax=Rubinisphaera margarita TaxID=2909586 RepID=UPI001EE83639|nr:DUF1501 domain-containing protein [Rubinisphaera margarita]MCG6158267.1 DUF1501 domain-containing protein [Rubinisphaera margarita]